MKIVVRPVKTRVFEEGEDLIAFIREHVPKIPEGSFIAVTSKIVSLAERRTVVPKSLLTKQQLIRSESEIAIPTRYAWLTVTQGMMVSSAGIDESNANGKLILLPKDSFNSAEKILKELKKFYKVHRLGVLITDSRTFPLRAGATGMVLGYAGFSGIKDYRKTPDIFGRLFKVSRANIADGLAASAVLGMGEGREQRPLALIQGVEGVRFVAKVDRNEIKIPIQDDMYLPLFAKFFKKK